MHLHVKETNTPCSKDVPTRIRAYENPSISKFTNFNKGELHMSARIQLKVHDYSELFSSYFSMVPSTQRTACNINALGFVSTQHTLHPQ